MKNITLISIVLASFFIYGAGSIKSATTGSTDIHLKVEGWKSGKVYLVGFHKNIQSTVDSADIDESGNSYFQREQALDPGFYLALMPDSSSLQILVDEDQVFSLETNREDLAGSMKVSGCEENELLYSSLQYDQELNTKFQAAVQQLQNEGSVELDQAAINELRQQFFNERDEHRAGVFQKHPEALFTKFELAQQRPEVLSTIMNNPAIDPNSLGYLVLTHFWDNVDFSDPRLLHTPVIFNKLLFYLQDFVPNQTGVKTQAIDILMDQVLDHPEYYRFFAEWISCDYRPAENPLMDPEALYIHMVDQYLTQERAFWADSTQVYAWQFRAKDRRNSLIGQKGANILANDPNGCTRPLYDITAPYIAVFFYHAECSHCIEQTPKLVQFYREWKARGLEVYAVAMDTEDDLWKTFIRQNDMDWVNVTDQDNRSIYSNYSVPGTPEIYLLNPARTIIGKHLQIADIPELIKMDQNGSALAER